MAARKDDQDPWSGEDEDYYDENIPLKMLTLLNYKSDLSKQVKELPVEKLGGKSSGKRKKTTAAKVTRNSTRSQKTASDSVNEATPTVEPEPSTSGKEPKKKAVAPKEATEKQGPAPAEASTSKGPPAKKKKKLPKDTTYEFGTDQPQREPPKKRVKSKDVKPGEPEPIPPPKKGKKGAKNTIEAAAADGPKELPVDGEPFERHESRIWYRAQPNMRKWPAVAAFDGSNAGVQPDEVDLAKTKSVLDYVFIFLNMEFISRLVKCTNQYEKENPAEHKPSLKKKPWTAVTPTTIYTFLLIILMMGVINKPRIEDYWCTKECLSSPFFRKIMTRHRFTDVLRFINYWGPEDDRNETDTENPPPKIPAKKKVTWLFDYFNSIAKKVYKAARDLCIDESMIAYKGKCLFRQYMPAKPIKWGIKCWCLCESITGYVLQIFPHFTCPGQSQNLYKDIVFKLLSSAGCLNLYHHLYFDNYYTLVTMFTDLCTRFKTYCCGTVRMNRRYLPKNLMKKTLSFINTRGKSVFSMSRHLMLSIWKDRKLVHVLSTIHSSTLSTCKRIVKNMKGKFVKQEFSCPKAIVDYNKYMGGVDLADMMYKYYSYSRKSKKWTKKIFFFVFELMQLNAYVMYNSMHPDKGKIPLYKFKILFSEQLQAFIYANNPERPVLYRIDIVTEKDRLTCRCMPHLFEKRSRCKVCYLRSTTGFLLDRNSASIVQTGCQTCDAHLCLPKCFTLYHTVKNYGYLTEKEKEERAEKGLSLQAAVKVFEKVPKKKTKAPDAAGDGLPAGQAAGQAAAQPAAQPPVPPEVAAVEAILPLKKRKRHAMPEQITVAAIIHAPPDL